MSPYHREVEETLYHFPRRTSSQHPESYIGGGQSKLCYIGLRVPQLHQAMRTGFSFFMRDPEEIALIWNEIWQESDCFEVMALALAWFYDSKQKSHLPQHWPLLKKWSKKIDNWAHADTLSGIYARLLEQDPKMIYPTLVKWNASRHPWLRRLSIVSLLYYSSQRVKILPCQKILDLVVPQLEYDHYYVQKGVGWTLRETYNVYPEKTYTFIKKNIKKISALAFSSATEKMNPNQKKTLKQMRRPKQTIKD